MHVVGAYLREFRPGEALFHGISAQDALMKLRVMLAAINVQKPEKYRCHDIRRGHALDLQRSGRVVWSCWVSVGCF